MEYWVAIVAQPISDLASFLKAFVPLFHHSNIPAGTESLTCLGELFATLVTEVGLR